MALTTANGAAVHPIGIGTWNVASRVNLDLPDGRYRNIEPDPAGVEKAIEGICYSIERGQDHLDCAELYGAFFTDEVVGQAIAASGKDRADLFIADKLWKHSTAPGAVRPTVEQMLAKLRTDYLDLLYIHAPWPEVDWLAAVPQIDRLIEEGVVRGLAVSNFDVAQMQETLAVAEHPIAANQVHYNCLHRDEADEAFRAFCEEHDIAVVAYQPVERGEAVRHPVVREVAAHHRATPAQVAIAWLLQRGALPIPKALDPGHIDENLGALDVTLSTDDIARIDRI